MNYKPLAVSLILLSLSGCVHTRLPGMYMNPHRSESRANVPVLDNGELVTEKAIITPITAQLIVDQVEAALTKVRPPASGPLPPRTTAEDGPYEYRIGPRDILNITVWDHPELTIPAGEFREAAVAGQLVDENGILFYPYAGEIKVAGLTVSEVRDALTRRLAHYIRNPQLDVRVAAFRSQRAYVVGEVKQPGIRTVTDIPLTIAEAISQSGDVTRDADMRHLMLSRGDKVILVDLLALYEQGDLSQNLLLQDGDVLNVPDLNFYKVFVLGEVNKPSSLSMDKGRMTLAEALGEVGGVDQLTSDAGRIYVIRGRKNKPEIFHLDARSPDALLLADRFMLAPRDVVYVDTLSLTRWNRVITQILPTANTLNTISNTSYSTLGF